MNNTKLYDIFCDGYLVNESVSLTSEELISAEQSYPEHTFKLKEKNHENHTHN